MRGPHNIFRLLRIGATFERTGALNVILDAAGAPRNIRIAAASLLLPLRWFGRRGDPEQPPIVRALTALGPAHIKFGQLLSTRPDIVGTRLASELRILQDRLPPFAKSQAKDTVHQELGIDVDEVFLDFSDPVAAASIAQVHRATIRDGGGEVAVKVLRPGIEKAFRRDIDAFHFAAAVIGFLLPFARRLRPRAVISHFEGVVLRELDLRMEAAAADELRAAAANDEGIRIPAVNWSLSGKRVVTVDWVDGVNLGDTEELKKAGHDLPELGRRLLQTFLRQALRDGHFHADLHQGNMKVSGAGDLILLDFGIMGRIDSFTRRAYAEILMGFLRRDYESVARVHFDAGYVPADRNVHDFALALRSVNEPISGMDASRISMARLLAHLFEVTEQFGMATRTELILLQRTMVVAEGVARSLDPNINIWETARPVVDEYVRSHVGIRAARRDIEQVARTIRRIGPRLPKLIDDAVSRLDPNSRPARSRWLSRQATAYMLGALTMAVGIIAVHFLTH